MRKKLQKRPELNYSIDVIDIVKFGSSVLEGAKPNDIDIAVMFKSIPIKEQLEEAQKIKKQLEIKFPNIPIHIKSYDMNSFFSSGNFAKENIIVYGKSLLNEKYFAENLGFVPVIQIYYSLKNLKKKDKVRFNYLLNGKGGRYGLLRNYGGMLLKPGLIEIKPEYEKIFTASIEKFISNFELKKILKAK